MEVLLILKANTFLTVPDTFPSLPVEQQNHIAKTPTIIYGNNKRNFYLSTDLVLAKCEVGRRGRAIKILRRAPPVPVPRGHDVVYA